jgi:Fe-S oxidoreductase
MPLLVRKTLRKAGEALFGLHQDAPLPHFSSKALTKQLPALIGDESPVTATDRTTGKVAIYVTCYGDHNEPQMVEDLVAVLKAQRCACKNFAGRQMLRHAQTGTG